MPVQKRPVVAFNDPNQQRRDRETFNQILDHSFDDSRAQTKAEKTNGITPINKAYPPLHVKRYGAVGDGVTNDAGALQVAFSLWAKAGGTLVFGHGETYRCDSSLTAIRTSGDAVRYALDGNGSTIYFPAVTSGALVTIGADEVANFLEIGGLSIYDLAIKGPETKSAITDDPDYTTTGLLIEYAGRTHLTNVQVNFNKTGIRTRFAFPLSGLDVSVRNNWIGLHMDESSNAHEWINLQAPNCRFSVVIYSTTTNLDDGKTNNSYFKGLWIEGSNVGVVADSGSGGSGNSRFRSFTFEDMYISGITYDVMRFGTVWDFDAPETRGSNCSEFIHDVRVVDGLWNTSGWTATHAAITYDSVGRCKQFIVDIPVISKTGNSNVFVNTPYGAAIRTRAYPTISDGVIQESFTDNTGAVVRRFLTNGNVIVGGSKGESGSVGEIGVELKNSGQIDACISGGAALRLNRQGSTGTIEAYFQADNLVGAVNAMASSIQILLDAGNNVIIATGAGSPEGVLTAGVGSLYLNRSGGTDTTLYTKNSGASNTGWVAVDNV